MKTTYTFLSVLGALTLPALAVEVGEKPLTPQLPDSPYVVHDETRPQPRIVEETACVAIPAPGDAVVLFDGTSLDAWLSGDGSEPAFVMDEGLMVAAGAAVKTKQRFGDIQLHLEWRLPEDVEVKGQKGGNSGIFFMGRYELQILQSHENETYPDGQATAIYGQYPPLVNATSPQGEWQSYDVVFKAPVYKEGTFVSPATITVMHNGVIVHAAKAYQGPTRHKKLAEYPANHPAKDSIGLQFHGDPIEFRNIWVRELGDYDEK